MPEFVGFPSASRFVFDFAYGHEAFENWNSNQLNSLVFSLWFENWISNQLKFGYLACFENMVQVNKLVK